MPACPPRSTQSGPWQRLPWQPPVNLQGMTTVVYTRISTDRTGEQAGVERQLQDCLDLCKRRQLGEPVVITDNDASAFTRRKARPGWRRLVAMMERGEVANLVAWHSDRLYRRSEDLNEIIRLIESSHVAINTVTEGDIDLSTATGRLTARVVGAVAEHESEHKSERIARKHREIAERGDWKGGGPRPFGYQRDGVTPDPLEAKIAREAVRRIQSGESATGVARWASERLSRTITQRSLVKSLTSPHIAGKRIHWPQRERDSWLERRRRGEVSGEYPPNYFAVHAIDGSWPAVIEETDWREMVALFEQRQYRRRPRRSLLAGIVQCGRCGTTMGWGDSISPEAATGRYATYRCVRASGGCTTISIGAEKLDVYVTNLIIEYATSLPRRLSTATESPKSHLEEARAALLTRLDDQAAAYGDGDLTREQFVRNKTRIECQLAELGSWAGQRVTEDAALKLGMDVVQRWEEATLAARAAAIRAFISRITVFPVGRGSTLPPQFRTIISWTDDDGDTTLEELQRRLPAPPAPLTASERREQRNQRDRRKRTLKRTSAKAQITN